MSICPQYLWIDTPHAYGRTTLKFRFLMGIFKFSDPPYGGSNEVFGKNQNFPLVLNIKLHLKMSVNYQLQISPPPNHGRHCTFIQHSFPNQPTLTKIIILCSQVCLHANCVFNSPKPLNPDYPPCHPGSPTQHAQNHHNHR